MCTTLSLVRIEKHETGDHVSSVEETTGDHTREKQNESGNHVATTYGMLSRYTQRKHKEATDRLMAPRCNKKPKHRRR